MHSFIYGSKGKRVVSKGDWIETEKFEENNKQKLGEIIFQEGNCTNIYPKLRCQVR